MGSANDDGLAVSQVPLKEIIRAMDNVHGLDISGCKPSCIVRTVERRSQATGCDSAESYLAERLLGALSEAEAFHRSLRVDYIREDRTLRNIPVVAVTASEAIKQIEAALRQQAEDLLASNAELKQFNRAMVGRESPMIELKQEINELRRLGEPPRHEAPPGGGGV